MSSNITTISCAQGGETMQKSSSKNQGGFFSWSQQESTRQVQVHNFKHHKENCLEELGLDSHARHGYHSSQYIWGHRKKILNFHI